ncbi:MAG: hypothetical protein P8181_01120, partial [bacterium]
MPIQKPLKVMLIAGGDSAERDVSLDSCKSIYEAIVALGHHVVVTDPLHPEVKPTEDPGVFFDNARIEREPPRHGPERFIARKDFMKVLNDFEILGCDIVFNGLHGGAGEDGTFQAVLDYLGIAYTGSGAAASMLAMNKRLAKRLVSYNKVPVAKQLYVEPPAHTNIPDIENRVMKTPSLPAVVKPNQEGSSVGVTIVRTKEQRAKAIEEASAFGGPYLIEEYIDGLESTAARLVGVEQTDIYICTYSVFYD